MTIIRCAEVQSGDFIRIGRLVFHVKHIDLRENGRVAVQVVRVDAAAIRPRNRWLLWRADSTTTRLDAQEAAEITRNAEHTAPAEA